MPRKYFKQFVDDDEVHQILKGEFIDRLGGYYKDPYVFDDDYYTKERRIRTPWSYFWTEK